MQINYCLNTFFLEVEVIFFSKITLWFGIYWLSHFGLNLRLWEAKGEQSANRREINTSLMFVTGVIKRLYSGRDGPSGRYLHLCVCSKACFSFFFLTSIPSPPPPSPPPQPRHAGSDGASSLSPGPECKVALWLRTRLTGARC